MLDSAFVRRCTSLPGHRPPWPPAVAAGPRSDLLLPDTC